MAQQLFYHPIVGGEDLVSPPLTVSPERCAIALNYECDMNGRLRRVDGYERFDGQTPPSSIKARAERDAARDAIKPVPGAGPVRGIWQYKGVKYAFRNAVTGDRCLMYKATESGWELVETPELPAGGRYSFDNYNFLGVAGGEKMYGANGVGPAFEFDGTTLTLINSLSEPDTPKFVKGHKLHLVLTGMPDGLVHVSGYKAPTSFNIDDGAATMGVGDDIGEAVSLLGGAPALIARNSTHIMYGSSADMNIDPWRIEPYSINTGGVPYTAQHAGGMLIYLDDRGLTTLSATHKFGNFAENALSKPVRPFYDARRGRSTCSVVCREKGQYRLFFDDGYVSVATVYGGTAAFTRMQLPVKAFCCSSSENESGEEELFIGAEDGYVYQFDKGTSFDGKPIPAKIQLHHNNFKSPRQKKRMLKAVLEIEAQQETRLSFASRYNNAYGVTVDAASDFEVKGGGGSWNEGIWGEFTWFSQEIASVSAYLDGTGLSCSLSIYSNADDEQAHIIQGLTFHYIARGLQR